MTRRKYISTFIRTLCVSALLLIAATNTSAQVKFFSLQKDSIPTFRGFALSFDLVGVAMMQLSDYGHYEGALRINIHDEWFPVFELGYGKADHERDEVTGLSYRTQAPYFRIGIDKNLLKDKHGPYRLYAGLRYAFTSYKVDLERDNFPDPVWLWDTSFGAKDAPCSQHWLEVVMGLDAKIYGPLHLGWSVKYKRRVKHDEGTIGRAWYIPGYGTDGGSPIGGTFNVIIDI